MTDKFNKSQIDTLLDSIKNTENIDIKNEILKKIKNNSKNIVDDINNLENNKKIYYFLIICGIYIFLNYFKSNNSSIIAFFIAIISGYYLLINNKNNNNDFFEKISYQIEALNKISNRKNNYLYTDIEIVKIYSNIIDLRRYSESDFDESLYNANIFLKQIYYLELNAKPSSNVIQNADITSKQCLNLLKNLYYNCENIQPYEIKLNKSLIKLQKIFDNYIKKYSKISDNDNYNNINNSSSFINNIDSPSPNDIPINGGYEIANRYNIFNNRF
jgi:hypothetical protein